MQTQPYQSMEQMSEFDRNEEARSWDSTPILSGIAPKHAVD